ncbi:MAG: hypothetical protein E7411_03810 [Ruminococcaceae bacterium]|nr:hypothetical protein [Oscillospiraceae bacterium]
MKKIDVHIHTTMWKNAMFRPGVSLITPEEIRESYKALDIEKGFILSLISPENRFIIQTNEEMEYVANNNPDIFYWLCNIDPRMISNSPKTDFSGILEYYKNKGAIGVGELTANLYTDEPMMENLFYYCGEMDMPVIIHISPEKNNGYGIVDDIGLPRLEKMLKKYPKLKILGHSQCFWSEISSDVTVETRNGYPTGKVKEGRVAQLLRNYPNLYCDLSAGSGFNALNRDTDYAYRFIEEFSDRLMFGTDICIANQETKLTSFLDTSFEKGCISEKNYKKICRENAIRLFKLKEENF